MPIEEVVALANEVAGTVGLELAAALNAAAERIDSLARGAAPIGSVVPYAGASAPSGWALCYGQAVSRAEFADLFAALGTNFGSGDGSTTFNLPDLRGRVPGGRDNMGGAAAARLTSAGGGVDGSALGAAGGNESRALAASNLPSHGHTYNTYTGVGGVAGAAGTTTGGTAAAQTTGAGPGTASAFGIVQPTQVLNYIIRMEG